MWKNNLSIHFTSHINCKENNIKNNNKEHSTEIDVIF